MFHVNEADEGKGVLTVENGKMTIHVRLASKKIVNVYAGLAKDAETDAANVIQPTTDTVTYSDGDTKEADSGGEREKSEAVPKRLEKQE